MPAIATGWTATKEHDDGSKSVLTVTISEFQGEKHLQIDAEMKTEPGPSVWNETQLGDLIAGLLAGAEQADYDMSLVCDRAGVYPPEIDQ